MTGSNSTRYLESPVVEAAKFLRDATSRFLKGKANAGDVEVAITEFRAAVASNKEK